MLEQIRRLIDRLLGRAGRLSPAERERLLEEIRRRLHPLVEKYFASDAPKPLPPRPWWSRLWWALRRPRALPGCAVWLAVILWIIAIVLWGFALYEIYGTDLKMGASPGPVCAGTGVDQVTRVADVEAWGRRRSHNAAVDAAEAFCATLAAECTGGCADGGTCAPGVHIIDEEQFTVWSWTTMISTRTVLEHTCQCTCSP